MASSPVTTKRNVKHPQECSLHEGSFFMQGFPEGVPLIRQSLARMVVCSCIMGLSAFLQPFIAKDDSICS
jgi:hypothetical protein